MDTILTAAARGSRWIYRTLTLNFQLCFIKQLNLVCGLFTASTKLLNSLQTQQFFENLDVVIALLNFTAFGRQFLLKTLYNRQQCSS